MASSKNRSAQRARAELPTLTRNEASLLKVIADRIFPATDTPGAVEAGALDYIDRALAGDYAPYLPLYRRGLRAVRRYARQKFAADFSSLTDEQKDAVLLDFEADQVPAFTKAAEFFETVRCHVLEGVFGEPRYGGNRGLIGWRLVGFPGQQFGYPDAYINQRVDLSPVAADNAPDEDSHRA